MTIIEKILAAHSGKKKVQPGEIVDVKIDIRMARDFGGAGVVQNIKAHKLRIADPSKTYFTFDCNPTGSDQLYAANQHKCRLFARENHITVFDINAGIGTHLAIDEGLAIPGCTLVSTDSHANILGAIGSFGQGMGDRDIAAAWSRGSIWFKVPESVKIILKGQRPQNLSAKDIILNLLGKFGADGLLGFSVELYGDEADQLTLDERITISSMATEMGAIAIMIPPSEQIAEYCRFRSYQIINPGFAGHDANYNNVFEIDVSTFKPVISRPGHPHDVIPVSEVSGKKIDSVFLGSCTNGRLDDMKIAAELLRNRKVAPGIVLKIVPSTDEIWKECLTRGYVSVFKTAGALLGSAGCAGCASGQIGQNGPGEITVSTGNRNFSGKQGKGDVYLSSVETAIASAIAGHITTADAMPEHPTVFISRKSNSGKSGEPEDNHSKKTGADEKPFILEGRVWMVMHDNIDTDMIYHNRHLAITDMEEMGQYTFGNLSGWENYAKKSMPGDILITGNNFGAGSSRQQAVDCFRSLGNQAIIARSFGAIYERNAINAGFPVLTYSNLDSLELENGDTVVIHLLKGTILNKRSGKSTEISKFSEIQKLIYQKGDLLLI